MNKWKYKFCGVVLLVLLGLVPWTNANTPTITYGSSINKSTNVEYKAETQKSRLPILPRELLAAGGCESNGSPANPPRQFNADGTVVRNTNVRRDGSISYDYGAFQLNSVHIPEAKKLGLDIINSEADNYAFALILYKRHGISPWYGYNPTTGSCSYYK